MAAAIARAELATVAHDGDWLVGSAGVAVEQPGGGIAPMAAKALRELDIPVPRHETRKMTAELCLESQAVFCMTAAHRKAIVALAPEASERVHCLDGDGDVAEPASGIYKSYIDCARRLRVLVRQRIGDINQYGSAVAGGA